MTKTLKRLLVKSVNSSICRTLRQWWSKHRSDCFNNLALKAKKLTDFQSIYHRTDKWWNPEEIESHPELRTSSARQPRGPRIMNIKKLALLRCTGPYINFLTVGDVFKTWAFVSMSDAAAAVSSDKFHLDDTTTTKSTLFLRIFLNWNHEKSRCKPANSIVSFLKAHKGIYCNWQTGLTRPVSSRPLKIITLKRVGSVTSDEKGINGSRHSKKTQFYHIAQAWSQKELATATKDFRSRRQLTEPAELITTFLFGSTAR